MIGQQAYYGKSSEEARQILEEEYHQSFSPGFFFRDPTQLAPDVFELSLCLAGSVSAGAYHAGVVDFLLQAFDDWEKAKRETAGRVPSHNVRLCGLSGASGGGMTALITAAAMNRAITPASRGATPPFAQNPLYGCWVKGIDVRDLLKVDDLVTPGITVQSLLDSNRIRDLACQALASSGPSQRRVYVADPLHVAVTISNLRGQPYQFYLTSNTSYGYQATKHEDAVRFAIQHGGSPYSLSPTLPNECLIDLSLRPLSALLSDWVEEWRLLAHAALGTGAFPIGLLPRQVDRKWFQCDPLILAQSSGKDGRVAILPVQASATPSDFYSCVVVDGGAFNNEPFDIARTYLAGILGSNPRTGNDANRAVIMVDPLITPSTTADDFSNLAPSDTLATLVQGLVLRAFLDQSRTHLSQWALAMDENIYSRFLVAPERHGAEGDAALCSSGLGAFSGFLSEQYREHDFRLGRRNCQKFLRDHFALPRENKLFAQWRDSLPNAAEFAVRDAAGNPDPSFFQIIPLAGEAGEEEPEPEWPSREVFGSIRDQLYDQIEQRTEAIYEALTRNMSWVPRQYLGLGWYFSKADLYQSIHDKIENTLKAKELY